MGRARPQQQRPSTYVPKRGDIITVDFEPAAGREQKKRRPAVVLSHEEYNRRGLVVVCPISTGNQSYPWHVLLPEIPDCDVTGVVQVDQIKSFDWMVRHAEFCGRVPDGFLEEVLERFYVLVEEEDEGDEKA